MTNLLIKLVACTLWYECRGEPMAGKLAVASVIWNSADHDVSRLETEIRRPGRYTCWRRRSLWQIKLPRPKNPQEERAWLECRTLADQMAAGTFQSTGTWRYYHATNIKVRPEQARGRRGDVIGRHEFYE